MSRGSRLVRLLIVIGLFTLGMIYVTTFHGDYVNSVSDKSMTRISDIYSQNFGDSDSNKKTSEKEGEEKEKEQKQEDNNNKEENKDNKDDDEKKKKEDEKKKKKEEEEKKKKEEEEKKKQKQQQQKDDGKEKENQIPAKSFKDISVDENYQRANATFVTLARNGDLWELIESIRHVEDRFNRKYKYDWVFLNDKPFDENFKKVTTSIVSGKTHYDVIPKEHWQFPDWIDRDKAALVREEMREKKIIYGDSVPYRHMCRFESGFFWRQPILNQFQYYWRVEPGIKLYCDLDYDVFKYMEEKKIKYGFTISLYEYIETIPTLWATVKKFIKDEANKHFVAPNNLMEFVSNDKGESYNLCHFWSNFEIADMDFWRSEAYRKFFKFLDHEGGFFYERWGDAPVHSIAASLFLNKNEVHHFEDIGYYHAPFHHCPTTEEMRVDRKCACNPSENFAWKGYSCTGRYYKAANLARPKGWSEQTEG